MLPIEAMNRLALYFHDERQHHGATANFAVGEISQSILDAFFHGALRRPLLDYLEHDLAGALDEVLVLAHVDEAAADDFRP